MPWQNHHRNRRGRHLALAWVPEEELELWLVLSLGQETAVATTSASLRNRPSHHLHQHTVKCLTCDPARKWFLALFKTRDSITNTVNNAMRRRQKAFICQDGRQI